MRAILRPLKGKYYGSLVDVEPDNGEHTTIRVWAMGDYRPSERQLEYWDYGTEQEAEEDGMMCDTHYESNLSYDIALKIVEALNDHQA